MFCVEYSKKILATYCYFTEIETKINPAIVFDKLTDSQSMLGLRLI